MQTSWVTPFQRQPCYQGMSDQLFPILRKSLRMSNDLIEGRWLRKMQRMENPKVQKWSYLFVRLCMKANLLKDWRFESGLLQQVQWGRFCLPVCRRRRFHLSSVVGYLRSLFSLSLLRCTVVPPGGRPLLNNCTVARLWQRLLTSANFASKREIQMWSGNIIF